MTADVIGNNGKLIELLKRNPGLTPQLTRAFNRADRKFFLPESIPREHIYSNRPLPIGFGQTNSQPYTVALMLGLLDVRPGMKILDLGCGSGWTSALLWELTGHTAPPNPQTQSQAAVTAVERIRELYHICCNNLKKAGYPRVLVKLASENTGNLGMPGQVFDRILVSAAAQSFPEELLLQLKPQGKLVIPVNHELRLYARVPGSKIEIQTLHGFSFVPLVEN